MTWLDKAFTEVFSDVSAGSPKVPQSQFAESGSYPIIDQGARRVAGFTDDSGVLSRAGLPVVLFGDHTRRFKFIDEEFAVGADGVKLLKPSDELDTKFAFHYLSSLELPNAGYSRHFKFLRDVRVPLPPLPEQRRIAAILDQAEELRAKRRHALSHADSLGDAVFTSMFGGSSWPTAPFGDLLELPLRNGVSPSSRGQHPGTVLTLSAITQGSFNPEALKTALFDRVLDAGKSVREGELLICRGNGNKNLVGRGEIATISMQDVAFPDTMIAARLSNQVVSSEYLKAAWHRPAVRRQIGAGARTTNGTYKVNQQTLEAIRVALPPIGLQRDFAQTIMRLREISALGTRHLAKLDELFASLQHRAFTGQL